MYSMQSLRLWVLFFLLTSGLDLKESKRFTKDAFKIIAKIIKTQESNNLKQKHEWLRVIL